MRYITQNGLALLLVVCGLATQTLVSSKKNYTINIMWQQATDKPYIQGDMRVGSPEVLLDTMFLLNFEEIVVVSKECKNCPIPVYDPSKSTTKAELPQPWTQQVDIVYTETQKIGMACRGIKDKVCLGDQNMNLCTQGGDNGFPFLITTEMNGNQAFIEDAMVGLSPIPDSKIQSFGEYLKVSELIDSHIVSISHDNITFGAYDETVAPVFTEFVFDKTLKNWAFKTNKVEIAGRTFLDNQTLVTIQNYVPGTYIWTTNPDLPAAFTNAMMTSGENITCDITKLIANCRFVNSTCPAHYEKFRNFTITTPENDVLHIKPESFLKQEGLDCIIQITVNAQQDFLAEDKKDVLYIGEDLFDNYYVILDYDTPRIGLAGFTTRYEPPKGGFPVWAIILIAVAGVAIIGGVAWFIIKRRKEQQMNSTLKNYNQLDH